MIRNVLPWPLVLLTVLRSFLQDLYGITKMHARQIFQRLGAKAATDPAELSYHPVLADIALVSAQQALSPLSLHIGPHYLDGVQD